MIHSHNTHSQRQNNFTNRENIQQGNSSLANNSASTQAFNGLSNSNIQSILQQIINLIQQLLNSGFGNTQQAGNNADSGSNEQSNDMTADSGNTSGNGNTSQQPGMGMTDDMNTMQTHTDMNDVIDTNNAQMNMPMTNNMNMGNMPANNGAIHSAEVFNTPVGADAPGPAFSGQAYEVTFSAQPGQSVSLASMLIETNDQFVGTDADGIELFDENGIPREGDITALLPVWDAGTEANEPVGAGANQPMRASGPEDSPPDSDNRVRLSNEGLPPLNELIKGDLSYNDDGTFTIRIENVSGQNGALDNPLSPGIVAVHDSNVNPFFDLNQPDRDMGLEDIAENGDPSRLLASLQAMMNMNPNAD